MFVYIISVFVHRFQIKESAVIDETAKKAT